jgi:HAD superfamily hydrolase (TIGR01458 family)
VVAVLLDLEGTLFAKEQALPGAVEAVRELRASGVPVRFLTNIDSRPPRAIGEQLAGYGLDVAAAELFTPVTAARVLLSGLPGARVLPVLARALHGEFTDWIADGPGYTHVLVGDCRDVLDYALPDEAFRAIREGAELVALQRGRYFRRADGDHIDTGAVVAGLEYATGTRAQVLGKPAADFFLLAARSLGAEITDCLVAGDDATTDIAGGRAAGARTVQVRTGKYTDQDGDADFTIDSVADLPRLVIT